MQEIFDKLIKLIHEKSEYTKKINPQYNTTQMYIDGLLSEIQEVQDEMKDNNEVYLEDELTDILRDYLNLLYQLQAKGQISSRENVLKKTLIKYEERVTNIQKGVLRKEIKVKQKERLANEHSKKYGNYLHLK